MYWESIYFTPGVGMTEADFFLDKAVSQMLFLKIRRAKLDQVKTPQLPKGFAAWQWKHESHFGVGVKASS